MSLVPYVENYENGICNISYTPNIINSISFSNKKMNMHTDASFNKNVPEYLILKMFVEDEEEYGDSIICSVKEMLEYLDSDTIGILMKPLYLLNGSGPFSLIEKNEKNYFIRFREDSRYSIQTNIDSARIAKEKLVEAIKKVKKTIIHLEEGDILILNNKTTLHGRTELSSKRKRVLQRGQFNGGEKDILWKKV